jgi:hypothetical protein
MECLTQQGCCPRLALAPARTREFLSPRAREEQILASMDPGAAHWRGRAAPTICKKRVPPRRRGLSLLIPAS